MNNKGLALYTMGRYHEAISCFDKAIEIKPNYLEALNNKGLAIERLKKAQLYAELSDLKKYYEKSHAIIIGISEYKVEGSLDNARNDAIAIEKVLAEKYEFNMLIPALFNKDATKDKLNEVFVDILQDENRIGPKDRVLIYYSGHGRLRKFFGYGNTKIKRGYLVPYDAQKDKFSSYLEMETVIDSCQTCAPKHILLILDCCYSGYAPLKNGEPAKPTFLPKEDYIKDITSRRVIQTLAASQEDQPASISGLRPGYSAFTGALLDILNLQKDLDNNGILTASSVGRHLEQTVG